MKNPLILNLLPFRECTCISAEHAAGADDADVDVSKMKEVINTAFSEYPAQSYGLVLWSHGEGWLAKSQNKTRW